MIQAYILLAAAVFFWGVTWPVMKVGVTYIAPVSFAALRMVIAAGAWFLLLAVLGRLRLPPREDLSVVISVALLQLAAPTALVHLSLLFVDAGRASLLAFTHPLWVAPVAVLFLREPFSRWVAIGLALGMTGLMILFNPFSFDWTDLSVLAGNGMLLLSAFTWGMGIVHVRAHRWQASPLDLAPWQMLLAAGVLSGFAGFREGPLVIPSGYAPIAILLFTGLIATGFCYWAAVVASRALPAMVSSLGFLGVPVVGILSSSLVLFEPLSGVLIAGLVLILLGIGTLVVNEVTRRQQVKDL